MIHDIKIETLLLDPMVGVILEGPSGEVLATQSEREAHVRLESECGDELFPALAWL
jgi:hypothetical protein